MQISHQKMQVCTYVLSLCVLCCVCEEEIIYWESSVEGISLEETIKYFLLAMKII